MEGSTKARCLPDLPVVLLLHRYLQPGYTTNNLEVQKLAYFLQERGEPLRLNLTPAKYGPYAENLQHVLQRIEGHFIYGYGDRASAASISVDSNAVGEAEAFVNSVPETRTRLDEVSEAITGFESPYGLELLATVHWVAQSQPDGTLKSVTNAVQEWSRRKAEVFTAEHIETAWRHLKSLGWIV